MGSHVILQIRLDFEGLTTYITHVVGHNLIRHRTLMHPQFMLVHDRLCDGTVAAVITRKGFLTRVLSHMELERLVTGQPFGAN